MLVDRVWGVVADAQRTHSTGALALVDRVHQQENSPGFLRGVWGLSHSVPVGCQWPQRCVVRMGRTQRAACMGQHSVPHAWAFCHGWRLSPGAGLSPAGAGVAEVPCGVCNCCGWYMRTHAYAAQPLRVLLQCATGTP